MSEDRPGRRGRHAGEGEGRSAADFLAAWHTGEIPAVTEEPTGPVTGARRARRMAAEAAARQVDPAGSAGPEPDDDATRRTPIVPSADPLAPSPARASRPQPPVSALSGLVLGDPGTRTPPARAEQPAATGWDDEEPTDRHPRYAAEQSDQLAEDRAAVDHPMTDEQLVTVEHPAVRGYDGADHLATDHHPVDEHPVTDEHPAADQPATGEHAAAGYPATGEHPAWDQTGGLEVIGADVEENHRGRRSSRRGDGAGRGDRPRRKRRPVVVVLSLLVLVGLVVGIVLGGEWLVDKINPTAEDYSGSGSGEVQVRVESGDSLTAIAGTLAEADVIASTDPFVDAASANPAAGGIQPGVYSMALQMSGQAALDRLLDPASRLFSRVTVPEGLRVDAILQRIADNAEIPLADLQAAAADPAALGLPAWANGSLEGHLFPATYDIEPGQTAVDVLTTMVARAEQTFDSLQIPEDQRLRVLTEASLVQAEAASTEDMAMVATVINNRVASGMPLQFDTTVNYATGKSGITTTSDDRATDSPYNTYLYPGLPPGAIDSPGEDALQAVLNPTPGDWLFFVVVNPDTGETRFAVTAEEHAANVLLFQEWLRENPSD